MKTMIDLDKKTNIMTEAFFGHSVWLVGCYGYSSLVLIHLGGGLDTPVYSEKK